ncbi:hypothetical protein EXIGLDRAFT_777444 [Exidia glandulosa HHB12029]|uniref:AB hydrolase-1 domain-containing protein n=1 Tax=Exidia glandulosa HHB12029 TaxID=1314781 RepID=A0A165D0I0_EXIGL|nr:hypothetical protein EXIGLDRAFT_777444 [Exidia glandulosa HHB12029]
MNALSRLNVAIFVVTSLLQASSATSGGNTDISCTETLTPITTTATNYDVSTGVATTLDQEVTGRFGVQLRFCEPPILNATRSHTLQVLVHGAIWNTLYWDTTFQPETYNYVHFAAARGFPTLNMARLGYGNSEHPDPLTVVQTPYDTAVLESIIRLARDGGVPGAKSRQFDKIVFVGHSLGSIILNGLIAGHPTLVDAAVFTGYAHEINTNDTVLLDAFEPARDVDPARFGFLPPEYVTVPNASALAADFWGPVGTYDSAALAFEDAHKDTITRGEILTDASPIQITTAPDFRGDVLTVNGEFDGVFCTEPKCANTAREGEFYPVAKSVEYDKHSHEVQSEEDQCWD